ncbi:MAG: hypothetical protein QOF21_1502 [Actinomycetota bacterium]|jgi:hypothetical protein
MASEDDIRRFALSLPNTDEHRSYNDTVAFRVAKKMFVRFREEGDSIVLFVHDLGEKEHLLASEPKKFWTTPHYDGYATILVRFALVKKAELEDLIESSYRLKANKTSLKLLDAM